MTTRLHHLAQHFLFPCDTASGTIGNPSPNHADTRNYVADAVEKAMPSLVNISIVVAEKTSATTTTHRGPLRRFFHGAEPVPSSSLPSRSTAGEGDAIRYSVLGGGSGFVISVEGFIATNAHVVNNTMMMAPYPQSLARPPFLRVTLQSGSVHEALLWALDEATDLAVLKMDPSELAKRRYPPLYPAPIGVSSRLRLGEWVVALGSPIGLAESVTVGIVSATARHANEIGLPCKIFDYIQTDASINPGNSGGPLCDLNGAVVGVNTMKLRGAAVDGISFSIPIDVAFPILQQLIKYRHVRRPFLGLGMEVRPHGLKHHHTPAEEAREEPLTSGGEEEAQTGVRIVAVHPKSPAERAGLRPDDEILRIDGHHIHDSCDVTRFVGLEVGARLTLRLRRADDGRIEDVPVVTEVVPGDLTLVKGGGGGDVSLSLSCFFV